MNIVFYSDKNYEYQAESLINSILAKCNGEVNLIYYTLGFESTLKYPNLIKVVYPIDITKKRF